MKNYFFLLCLILISSCSQIPVPSIIAPSENKVIQKVSFGDEPIDYQNILKNYLITNLKNYKTAKVEFINEPSKLSINHLGNNYSGYRVCLSINKKRGEHYIGYKNHFFLINNNKVDLHLFDSGLLKIPFEYCVSRNRNNEYFIDDIPDKSVEISIESMDTIELSSKDNLEYKKLQTEIEILKLENEKLKQTDNKSELSKNQINDIDEKDNAKEAYVNKNNIYISCLFGDMNMTYIFNASEDTFKLINKLDIVTYELSFNDAYIVASNESLELTINRVTGKATLDNKILKRGMCNLTNKTRF